MCALRDIESVTVNTRLFTYRHTVHGVAIGTILRCGFSHTILPQYLIIQYTQHKQEGVNWNILERQIRSYDSIVQSTTAYISTTLASHLCEAAAPAASGVAPHTGTDNT